MSADNGIYILATKDQYRVIHAMAIDNLTFSFIDENNRELLPTRLVEYFGKSKYTRDLSKARDIAFKMEKKQYICEYGVNTISIDKTWNQIVNEAKELAPKEIEAIKNYDCGKWDYEIKRLEEIISL
jgi:hypothetical protein